MARSVQIGEREIGPGENCYFIAATGSGHNGSLELAKKLIDAAADGGAHAVMFQAYGGDIYHDEAPVVRQLVYEGRIEDRPGAFAEYMRRRVMDPGWHPALSDHARERHVDYLPSVFGDSDLNLLADYHRNDKAVLAGLGIESMDHQDSVFVAKVAAVAAELGIPVVMSTGVREGGYSVNKAVDAARSADADFVLLHSVFGSPSAPEEQGLNEIRRLQDAFEVPVGFSDHSVGHPEADTPAMARDAIFEAAGVIKVQIRLPEAADKAPGGPHRAVTPDEFRELVTAAREAENDPRRAVQRAQPHTRFYQGDRTRPRPSEQRWGAIQRTVIATSDITPGTELTSENCTTRRGGVGLPARDFTTGITARTALTAGRVVRTEEIDRLHATERRPRGRALPSPAENGPTGRRGSLGTSGPSEPDTGRHRR